MLGPIVVLLGAYLLGTFPTAALVTRGRGRDPLAEGSGNPGATNVYRIAGARAATAVLLGDILKGATAAGVGLALSGRPLALAAGAAAVVGHCFPLQRWGRGGKGVACTGGLTIVLFPLVALVIAVEWFVVARLANKASLASVLGAVLAPIGVAALGRPAAEVLGYAAITAFVLARHASNIARLLRGEEGSLRSTR